MKLQFILLFTFLASVLSAQVAPNKYFIEFTDKNGTPFSIQNPQAFLSQRSIDRRSAQNIAINEDDLPVNPSYINGVKGTGATVINISKWLNGVEVYTTSSSVISAINALPYVKSVLKSSLGPVKSNKFDFEKEISTVVPPQKNAAQGYDYGQSYNQIHMLNGDVLHINNYRGQGKVIAVLDAGFLNADIIYAFDSLRNEGRLLGTKDFVNPGGNVYQVQSSHGTMVLSTMAGNAPGQIIGTAPKASYWLLRSEDAETEYYIEEFNWVSAAEFADSVGADIINSSLGYTTFDDTTYNQTCADLTGNATPVTRGANMAAARGIAVINSAGNSGGSAWTCVGAPADGDLVTAIGAVDPSGNYAYFSSVGVDTAGRVKPNVAAQGMLVWVIGGEGGFVQSNGTSFASPIIAGMVACLWQAYPASNREMVINTMERSASHYNNPDSLTGYGIPDFAKALLLLSTGDKEKISAGKVVPNPFTDRFTLYFASSISRSSVPVFLYDITGRLAGEWRTEIKSGDNILNISPGSGLAPGVYILSVEGSNFRLIRQ